LNDPYQLINNHKDNEKSMNENESERGFYFYSIQFSLKI